MTRAVQGAFTEEEITAGLMALIAWAGNATAASRSLKESGEVEISNHTLIAWSTGKHAARYQELRDKYREPIERRLASEFTDIAIHATNGMREAIDQAIERLEKGRDTDPSRTAANLATVADKATGKMLALTGRPSQGPQIDNRSIEERLRKLAQMGVIAIPDADVEEEPAALGAPDANGAPMEAGD